jgi:NTE family protein
LQKPADEKPPRQLKPSRPTGEEPTAALHAAITKPQRTRRKTSVPETRTVNLALQGGGAHGAYTWGVLDRLLEEDRLRIEGISGTSAGAMNAAVLAMGMARDGRPGARKELESFWTDVASAGRSGPFSRSAYERFFTGWNSDYSPMRLFMDTLSRFLSPYQLNPLNFNPLRNILAEHVDFKELAKAQPIKLFISATHVRTGKIRVFECKDLSLDAVMASACLPTVFQTVYVDGEPYWDGGYMGNPAIFPLIYGCDSRDVLIVQINPIHREDVPQNPNDIADRVNEISFNSSLMREMRTIEFVGRMVEAENLDPKRYKRMLVHMIEAEREMGDLGLASKLDADWDFLLYLKTIGRDAADKWLKQHWGGIGKHSTLNIREVFL